MKLSRKKILTIWEEFYGPTNEWGLDVDDRYIFKHDYLDRYSSRLRPNGYPTRYNYGWMIELKQPEETFKHKRDAYKKENIIIKHI